MHNEQYIEGPLPATLCRKLFHIYPSLFICNTDPYTQQGSHWVMVWFSKEGSGLFFDSYGFAPEIWSKDIARFIRANSHHHSYTTKQLQWTESRVCGKWCLYAADQLCREKDLVAELYTNFTSNYGPMNDWRMNDWVDRHFGNDFTNVFRDDCSRKRTLGCNVMKLNLLKGIVY